VLNKRRAKRKRVRTKERKRRDPRCLLVLNLSKTGIIKIF
jgi:hypothetical protein